VTLTYVVEEHELLKPDGTLLKRLSCPLQKRWQDLRSLPGRDDVRNCRSCQKDVISLTGKDEATIIALLSANKKPCIHLDYSHPAVKVIGDVTQPWEKMRSYKFRCTYRVIKTARSLEAMNAGLSRQLRPLVKMVEPNPKLRRTCTLVQNRASGEVTRTTELGAPWEKYDETLWEVVATEVPISDSPKSAIAAYLLPHDLRVGERVVLEDVIEEIVGMEHSGRGGIFATRLNSAEAVWDGEDLFLDERFRFPGRVVG
jgi:hypothetical protein